MRRKMIADGRLCGQRNHRLHLELEQQTNISPTMQICLRNRNVITNTTFLFFLYILKEKFK